MKRDFQSLDGEFDLLVCGGGIHGAWITYDASLRGLKVALVEKQDWGSATSSASSKLIHGGLRYLEGFDFRMVRKSLAERKMLLRVAPHCVWPLRFGLPVYAHARNGTWKLKAGLTLYDLLAGLPDEKTRHHHFSTAHFLERFSFLDATGLKGGFTYADAQTDDARLVLELVTGAMDHGAVCVNHAEITAWNEENGRVCGATVQDKMSDAVLRVPASESVHAAGQWAAATSQGRPWCRLTKGVHLVLPALPVNEALLLTTEEDGRVFFILPWYGRTLLGTTDTDYRGDVEDRLEAGDDDADYLLSAANHFLRTPWTRRDVIASFAGLRVLKRSEKSTPSSVSRDWELKTADNGLHYSIGGKLTTAREDAAWMVDAVCSKLGRKIRCSTWGRDFPWKPSGDFAPWSEEVRARAEHLGVDAESAEWLVRRHGTRIERVFAILEKMPGWAERIVADVPLIHADLIFCAREEMAQRLSDLLRRRMPLLILAKLSETEIHRLAERVAPEMGWSADRISQEVKDCWSVS